MNIKVIEKSKDRLRFQLDGASVAFANALRRTMISEVPTYAIGGVTFIKNDSVLYDEIIAHRLGLIPLKTDLPDDLLLSKVSSNVKFTLQKDGPGTIYSSDLRSSDKVVKPAYDNIPIVKLRAGEKLVLEAEAVLGTGREHAKWQPTTICTYMHPPKQGAKGEKKGDFKTDSFIFTVESSGSLRPEQIVNAAADILALKAGDFSSQLKNL